MPLDADVPPGPYRLQVGAYTRADRNRLPVLIGGRVAADTLWLNTVEVKP